MAEREVVGEGPVVVFDNTGKRLVLPLSQIYFDGDQVKVRGSTPASVIPWLTYLKQQNRLRPDETLKPAVAAAVFTAARPGLAGNGVVVTITPNVADPAKVDIEVKETNRYEGVSVATIERELRARPALLRLSPMPPNPPDPAPGVVAATAAVPAAAGNPRTPATWTTASFVLTERDDRIDAGVATVTVSNVAAGAAPKAFTLEIVWTSTITAVTAADLAVAGAGGKPAKVAYSVAISPPPGGGPYKVPRAGVVQLQGGAEAAPEKASTATLFAVS